MEKTTVMYRLGKETGEAVASIINSVADKKVNLSEGFDMLKEGGTLFYVIGKNYKEIGADFKDGIQDEEKEDLRAGFIDNFDLVTDTTEVAIEGYFNMALDAVTALANLFVKKPEAE